MKRVVLIGLGAALLIALIILVVVLAAGGDDENETGATTSPGSGPTETEKSTTSDGRRDRGGGGGGGGARRIALNRASGDFAVASATGTISRPKRIRVRTSAAPKQDVEVHWAMACARASGAKTAQGEYTIKPPDTRAIEIPTSDPRRCVVSASVQLKDSGRVKVALLGN